MLQVTSGLGSKFAGRQFASAHVVPIKDPRTEDVIAHQLRFDGGGPGNSHYFSASKFGGPEKSLQAAKRLARVVGVKIDGKRPSGRREASDRGIWFEWVDRVQGATLYVCASWTDRKHRRPDGKRPLRRTAYSTAKHGLEGALDKAIDARISNGAPTPDKQSLLKLLQRAYRVGPK